jgi:hypothetical protein
MISTSRASFRPIGGEVARILTSGETSPRIHAPSIRRNLDAGAPKGPSEGTDPMRQLNVRRDFMIGFALGLSLLLGQARARAEEDAAVSDAGWGVEEAGPPLDDSGEGADSAGDFDDSGIRSDDAGREAEDSGSGGADDAGPVDREAGVREGAEADGSANTTIVIIEASSGGGCTMAPDTPPKDGRFELALLGLGLCVSIVRSRRGRP